MNSLGKEGEQIAQVFIRKKGFKILKTNYRTVFGEIDIIAKDKDVLVFIEVKARADIAFGHPFEAVDNRKKEKLRKVALCYMKNLKKECAARFDVLSINVKGGTRHIEHFQDAFEV